MRMTKPSEAALELLHDLAGELSTLGPVEVGTMFRSPGIRTGGTIVAFLGSGDRLIVKVPRERALELISNGTAAQVTMGTREMREWVEVPFRPQLVDETRTLWLRLAREAFDYVSTTD
jgi:TfoX/Sxy family transcriptional regulator of competence genes